MQGVMKKTAMAAAMSTVLAGHAWAIVIDNGVTGDGAWSVDVLDAGDAQDGTIDPTGAPPPDELIYEFFTYIDVGNDGNAVRLSASTTSPATLTAANEVTSSGSFNGPNGSIDWQAVASIQPGSLIYNVVITFTSSSPFGNMRVINYFDEDVNNSVNDDVLVVIGTPGADDFQLFTVDGNVDVGVGHSASYNTASGMSYVGWAADQYSDLRAAIVGTGAGYSVSGVVDTTDLPPMTDPRFPSNDAYGPNDITNAYAFDFDPNATTATVIFALGGAPDAVPPEPPSPPPPPQPSTPKRVPVMGPLALGLLSLVLGGLGVLGARRKRL